MSKSFNENTISRGEYVYNMLYYNRVDLDDMKELIPLLTEEEVNRDYGNGPIKGKLLPDASSGPGGYPNVVKLLLESPFIDVNVLGKFGLTALQVASFWGSFDICEMLLNHENIEFMPDHLPRLNTNPLIFAVRSNNIRLVKMLLAKFSNIDIHYMDYEGTIAYDYAKKKGYNEIVQLLEEYENNQKFDIQ